MEHIPRDPYPYTPPKPRQTPMKVLCLGPSRTATMSTWVALKKLGYTPYHAVEAGLNSNNQHYALWADALRAKYQGIGRKWKGASDFDRVLGGYDAVTDIPAVLFVDELLEAYPSAKVVLQLRDPESWARSVVENFGYVLSGRLRWAYLLMFDKNMTAFNAILRQSLGVWSNNEPTNLQAFERGLRAHNDHVRRVVPQENLLEFSPARGDGWKELCAFLGNETPKPEEPFPRVNEQGFTRGLLDWVLFMSVVRSLPGVLLRVGVPAVAAVGVAVWWLRVAE